MIIHWYGHACFKLQSNYNEVVLAIDPFDNSLGWRAPRITADIAVMSTRQGAHNNIDAIKSERESGLFVIENPGEYEVGGVFVHSIPITEDSGTTLISAIRMDECSIAHLGTLNRTLTESELEELGNVDILCIPIGGNGVLDAKKAMSIINEIEPRIVIPMQYMIAGLKRDCDGIDRFLKEFGVKDAETLDKFKISKKDLPVDTTKIICLNPV